MPPTVDVPNPWDLAVGAVGQSVGAVAQDALDSQMQKVWNFGTSVLSGAYHLIDRFATPDLNPVTGELAGWWPVTRWVGLVVLVALCFVQTARAAFAGGKALATLFVGAGQYAVVLAGVIGVSGVMVSAANALGLGILSSGLHVDQWSALSSHNSVLTNGSQAVGGVGLGVLGLFLLIPGALTMIGEAALRHVVIALLVGATPIVAAGLVMDTTKRWFWISLRWVIAAILLSPTSALVMVAGYRMAAAGAGADGQQPDDAGVALVRLVLGTMTLLVAVLCPLALFKLLAFVDPNTISGAQVRGLMSTSGPSSGDGGGSPAGSSTDGEAAHEARYAAMTDADGVLADPGSGTKNPTEKVPGMLGQTASRLHDTANASAARASGVLDAAGVGHQGSASTGAVDGSTGGGSSSSSPSPRSDAADGAGETGGDGGPLDDGAGSDGGPGGSGPDGEVLSGDGPSGVEHVSPVTADPRSQSPASPEPQGMSTHASSTPAAGPAAESDAGVDVTGGPGGGTPHQAHQAHQAPDAHESYGSSGGQGGSGGAGARDAAASGEVTEAAETAAVAL